MIEPKNLDADYYAKDGWVVEKRPYGTRVYDEMFTLMEYSTGLPLIEIRRSPVGNKSAIDKYVIDPHSCHIRLCNRTCYYDGACKLLWDFIQRYGYIFCRISRIDICLDFEKFDKETIHRNSLIDTSRADIAKSTKAILGPTAKICGTEDFGKALLGVPQSL